MTVVMRGAGNEAALVAPAREILRQLDAELPMYDVRSMTERMERSLWIRRAYSWLFAAFAAVAILLAAAGIYGVISFAVSQRTREIGIRIALGARPGQVMSGVLRNGMLLVGNRSGAWADRCAAYRAFPRDAALRRQHSRHSYLYRGHRRRGVVGLPCELHSGKTGIGGRPHARIARGVDATAAEPGLLERRASLRPKLNRTVSVRSSFMLAARAGLVVAIASASASGSPHRRTRFSTPRSMRSALPASLSVPGDHYAAIRRVIDLPTRPGDTVRAAHPRAWTHPSPARIARCLSRAAPP